MGVSSVTRRGYLNPRTRMTMNWGIEWPRLTVHSYIRYLGSGGLIDANLLPGANAA